MKEFKIVVFIDPGCSGLQVKTVPVKQKFKKTIADYGLTKDSSSDYIYGLEIIDGTVVKVSVDFT